MKARGKKLIHVFMPVIVACLYILTCIAYAAPAATQKSTQQTQSVTGVKSPAPVKYDPNASPKGTITIPVSTKGNVNALTWVVGSYQYIQWICSGLRTNLVDVTLWQNNSKVVVIGTSIATGQTAFAVPKNMATGSYELRLTSESDTRVETRRVITIVWQPQSREFTGVDYIGMPWARSREFTGIDYIGMSWARSREFTGVDYIGMSWARSREFTGVDYIGTPK